MDQFSPQFHIFQSGTVLNNACIKTFSVVRYPDVERFTIVVQLYGYVFGFRVFEDIADAFLNNSEEDQAVFREISISCFSVMNSIFNNLSFFIL